MSASVMSSVGTVRTEDRNFRAVEAPALCPAEGWSPEKFAQEQIRSLVRQIFSPHAAHPIRQVVFSAVESNSEVAGMCRRVGETLAGERVGAVAIVGTGALFSASGCIHDPAAECTNDDRSMDYRKVGARVRRNCWLVPAAGYDDAPSLLAFLAAIRKEFEYSVVAAPAIGESGYAMTMAQYADGLVLVVSAHNTRRATAHRVKQAVDDAEVRLLGAVLSDREFPIPEALYRRL